MRTSTATLLLVLVTAPAQAQLTIRLRDLPAATPAGATIYVAGTFNMWNPAAPAYALAADSGGALHITLPATVRGPIEFKFTLGSWETVETNSSGGDLANRSFTIPDSGAAVYRSTVAGWKQPGSAPVVRAHTARPGVRVLSDSFAMPQLDRARRVWIYLPADYARSRKRYPVLYMHDGQNVFDIATSYVGEWGVDETLDSLHAQVIVVAVDHGAQHRLDEYNPWRNARYGGGEGAAYVEFLVKTLKPYIDAHYRTQPDRAHTAIAGSSMGGLISLYAALKYPEVFGKAGVFSPSLWIAPEIVSLAHDAKLGVRPRLYFVSAGNETRDQGQIAVSGPLMRELVSRGYVSGRDLVSIIREDGAHSEWFWRREFPAAYQWLFAKRP
ncbi:MAG TPA: alpha/beta hydrolase-fold protein [Longimicrobiales bacterium]